MNKFDLQKLRDLPIEGVAERLGLTVTRHKTLCPYHDDKHPSLSFYRRNNTFKCFVCDAHGGVIDLTMQVLGKDFKEACRWLADEHHIIVSCHPEHHPRVIRSVSEGSEYTFESSRYEKYFQRPYLNAPARTFLFEERKLDPRVIRWCKLNSWTDRHGTPWLQIPYFDIDGKLIGVQNRRLSFRHTEHPHCHPERSEGSENTPKFLFPKDSQCSIYNLPILKLLKEGEALWITEGCSDCWSMLSSGRKAIAIPSATLLKASDLNILKEFINLNLHMYPDADIPGEKLFLQLKTHCPQLVRHQLPTNYKDFSEYYASNH